MDRCVIFVVVVGFGMLVMIPFVLSAQGDHGAKLVELRERYATAKSSGEVGAIESSARAIVEQFRVSRQPGLLGVSEEIYRDALGFVKNMPELKPFALEMGRLAYGLKRKDKNPTVYDEQAILNDINAHM